MPVRVTSVLPAAGVFAACCALASMGAPPLTAQSSTLEIPVVPGLAVVLAVHAPDAAAKGSGIAKGDYEMVVALTEASAAAVTLKTRIDSAQDESGKPLLVNIERRLPSADLA